MGLAPSDVKRHWDSRLRKSRPNSTYGVSPASVRCVSEETRLGAAADLRVNRNRPLPYPGIPGVSSRPLHAHI